MSGGFHIRQVRQGEGEPVCTHCESRELVKAGHCNEKQRYVCRSCQRTSYGLPSDLRPACPFCRKSVHTITLPDGRYQYRCPHCKRSCLSEYSIARQEPRDVPMRHLFSFWMTDAARAKLVDYAQATRCTSAQAVRAIFRHVLTGTVFPIVGMSPRRRAMLPPSSAVTRDPSAVYLRFPNLQSETARRMQKNSGGLCKRKFQPTILAVQRISVCLDDEAKEGLVYAMRRLEMNHADAARWLLTYAQIPERSKKL